MSYASPADVAARLGRELTPAEVTQAQTLLDDAESMLQLRIPDLAARVTAATIDIAAVIRVEANAVKRVIMNPLGVKQHSEGLGPQTESDTYDSAVSSGRLYIDGDDFGELQTADSAFTIYPASSPSIPGRLLPYQQPWNAVYPALGPGWGWR